MSLSICRSPSQTLDLGWTLLNLEYGTFEDVEEEQRSGYWDALEDLVRLVDPQSLTDSKVIVWEIVNACAVVEWDLALRLYNRLVDTGALSEARFRALRGQFLYLAGDLEQNWSDGKGSTEQLSYWSPRLEAGLEAADVLMSMLMCARATVPPKNQKPPDQAQHVRFSDAATDLRTAIDLDGKSPSCDLTPLVPQRCREAFCLELSYSEGYAEIVYDYRPTADTGPQLEKM